MTEKNIALVVGATGLSGSYAARHLKEAGRTVVTMSRSAVDLPWSDRHIAADLEDADASKAALKAASDVTHVFYCTWSRRESEAENVRVNAAMIRNLFDGIPDAPVRHAALVTDLKHYLGSFDAYPPTSASFFDVFDACAPAASSPPDPERHTDAQCHPCP